MGNGAKGCLILVKFLVFCGKIVILKPVFKTDRAGNASKIVQLTQID